MKKIFLILLLLPVYSMAQFRGNNWAVSDSIMLSFSQTGVTVSNSVLHNTQLENQFTEGMATISDESGQLLFYTNGNTVWNRNNNVMPNGDSLQCNYSVTNGVVIIPFPEHDSLYYIFYINFPLTATDTDKGFSYSIVNMNLDNGLGDIIQSEKNISLILGQMLAEKVCAVKHGNGSDWWIMGHGKFDDFYSFLVTPDGIQGPFWQTIGLNFHGYFPGEICISNKGSKLGLVNAFSVEVFDFNRCNGTLSDGIIVDSVEYTNMDLPFFYGCSFSSDATKFYVTKFDAWVTSFLFQYDLNNVNPVSTKTTIWENLDSDLVTTQLELAPNGKIYVNVCTMFWPDTTYSFADMNLSVINQPDSLGSNCDFQSYSLFLNGHRTTSGLPNMPNYNLSALDESACDTLGLGVDEIMNHECIIRIYPNPASDELTIEVLNGIAPTQIEIKNELGVTVMKLKQTKPNQQLNIKSLSAGVYFIKVQMQDGSVTVRKFVRTASCGKE